MPAYMIGMSVVLDPGSPTADRGRPGELIMRYGGRFLAAGRPGLLKGELGVHPDTLGVIEFPSLEHSRAYWAAAEQARREGPDDPIKSIGMVLLIDGFPDP